MNKEDDQAMPTQTPLIKSEEELSFDEQLKFLSKSIGSVNIGEHSDQICREVRGKES
ncbi:hypothetical protein [Falsibacillus pallidus]|uniref:Uncharacterized protein n=1 Tax=Falsibacillus pallidus TaxID=493781 RepID=A0A370G0I7_9BACI|nr:hypothetical protein [Falsibacillus pallidus]RDI37252.1 hypothetical protein DFR59_12242 [Falsibacillus pallidus]